jgi:hypothetical protein
MVAWLVLAAALQAGAGPDPAGQLCALVTPRGDLVGFQMLPGEAQGDTLGLVATPGSVWPSRRLTGDRASFEAAPSGKSWFAFGGREGLVLELGRPARDSQRQTATLSRRDGGRPGLPLAFGYCAPGGSAIAPAPLDPNADPNAIGADIPAFDPRRWPAEDCGLLLSDGRRMQFGFRLAAEDQVEFSSPGLWAGRRVTTTIRWLRVGGGVQLGAFNRRGGPSGTQTMIVESNGSRAAKLIHLLEVGDPSAVNQTGYGICGYVGLVRRPAREN